MLTWMERSVFGLPKQDPPPDHRTSVRLPVIVFNVDMQRAARVVADAQRVRMRPVWDTEKMRQSMAAVAGLQSALGVVADAQRVRMRPVWDTEKMRQSMAAVVSILETAVVVPRDVATDAGPARVPVDIPGKTSLFPGLVNPWQQIREWDLLGWIVFLTLIVTAVGIVLGVAQPRSQVGVAPEDLELILRIIQEYERTTSTTSPASPHPPCSLRPTRPLDGERACSECAPIVCPRPTVRPASR
jgi:hypothetical protein